MSSILYQKLNWPKGQFLISKVCKCPLKLEYASNQGTERVSLYTKYGRRARVL